MESGKFFKNFDKKINKNIYLYNCILTEFRLTICPSHSRIFHSFWDIAITGEGMKILTYVWHKVIGQWGFINVPHLICHGPTIFNGHLWGPWH